MNKLEEKESMNIPGVEKNIYQVLWAVGNMVGLRAL